MTDPHEKWLTDTLRPLKDVPPSPRQAEIRAQWLAEAVSEMPAPRPNEQVTHTQKERSMFIVNRNRTFAASVALVLGIFGSFFVSPNLRAIAQEIINQFFVVEATNIIQDEIRILSAEEIEASQPLQQLTLEDAESTLGYKLTLPDAPPNPYDFQNVSFVKELDSHSATFTNYACQTYIATYSLTIAQIPIRQAILNDKIRVGADAVIEQVALGDGITGEYVRGRWDYGEIPTQTMKSGTAIPITAVWSSIVNHHSLMWIQGAWQFAINGNGGETDETICPLTKENIIRMAQEMVSQTPDATPNADAEGMDDGFFVRAESNAVQDEAHFTVVSDPTQVAESNARELTREQAEVRLGYPVVLPDVLPSAFEFRSLMIDDWSGDELRIFSSYYCATSDGDYYMSISRLPVQDTPALNPIEVGADAVINTFTLGKNLTGQYIEGGWIMPDFGYPIESGTVIEFTKTWDNNLHDYYVTWNIDDEQYLMWVHGDSQVTSRCYINKLDVIRMAREMVKNS